MKIVKSFRYHSIFFKYLFLFLTAIFFGCVIAFHMVIRERTNQLLNQLETNTITKANVILELHENYQIDVSSIAPTLSDPIFEVSLYNNLNEITSLPKEQLEVLQNTFLSEKELFIGNHSLPIGTTFVVFLLEDHYYLIRPHLGNSFEPIRSAITTAFIISASICSLIMVFSMKLLSNPLTQLSNASKKIANGDFNIHIKTKQKGDIRELISNFNLMAKELRSMEIMRNDFISSVSHEFKTPLTAITGYVKLLDNCTDEEKKEYITIINEETKRLSQLTSNILLLNKLENETIKHNMQTFKLDEQIRHVVVLLEKFWSEKQINISLNLVDCYYTGNKSLLHQVWQNLIDNAIKFSKEKSSIIINLKKDNNKIIFSIEDTAGGITNEEKKHIFEKFYKADKSRNTEGNGLGLSIAKKIVDLHYGEIFCESSPTGTIFTIYLENK